jgi:hypothetical protein
MSEPVPMGIPSEAVPMGIPIEVVNLVSASANAGLSPEDLAQSAAFAIQDWRLLAAGRPQRRGWLREWCSCCFAPHAPDPNEPHLHASAAEGGGTKLVARVKSPESLMLLSRRLAATSTAPLASLQITCEDGYGPGTANPAYASGEGFALLTRALMPPPHGSACLGALRELSFSKIIVDDVNAHALAASLSGHPGLRTLELWNVQLEDGGALAIGTLAAPGGPAALESINMGKNLMSGVAKEQIERAARPEVSVRMY